MVIDFCETEEVSYNDAKVVCYFASWATYRPSDGKFDVEDIDSSLCTHAIYAFAGINNHTLKMEPLDEYNDLLDDYGLNAYGRFVDLKTNNPHLKVLLAVGGYNQPSSIFSRMASEQNRRERFIDSALSLIQKYGFDGLDLDWEFPTTRGGKPEDKENFVLLVQEMKKKFEESSLIITAAVGLGCNYMETVYDFKNLSDSLDSIHLMAYDFNGNWQSKTDSYSPLFSRPEYTGKSNLCSINATVNVWLEGGADPKKLVLGVGAYGQTYLVRNCIGEIGELGFGAGQAGPYTKHSGTLGYNEICEAIKNDGASIERDEYSVTPYTCLGSTWASFDDILSAKIKSMWGKETGLGGGMIWSIDTDDFLNKCSDGRYPILRAINEIWRNVTPVSVKTLNPVKRLPMEAKVICYYSSWAYYRHGEGKFTVNDIKPSLCTHILYCFAGINEWSYKIESTDKNVDIYQNGYANITNLKLKYPNLKIMLSIGGASKKSVVFSQMAADSYSRTTFIDSVINYLQFYSFDGLDLMWEYPANNGGSDEDKENFALLITEMREVSKQGL
ncbi:UNVERIFIED_CONTAM: hypothetical protein GTU68_055264 [Idotea baltica]|nr:hypothetical protein [Idotea baltica]